VTKVYPKAIWHIKTKEPIIYLTFDDGPIPGLTEWVLDILKEHSIKATFFCVGDNIQKNPRIFKRILSEGHSVGNHTYNHIKGYKTKTVDYLKNVRKCESLTRTRIFRPPYGQLKPKQYSRLIKLGFKVVLWDVISYDYEKIPKKECFKNVKNNIVPGSIVLFHDNLKAEKNLKYALPKTIEHFLKLNYNFAAL
jgi:peptidoglycan/xylan/chitin deacetylase (PgdA/CDA1 family)